jgi:chondroitin AC lyase
LADLMMACRGTPWAVPEAKLAIVRRYLLDGLQWAAYRGAFDINSNGRLFQANKAKRVDCLAIMERMRQIDPNAAHHYEDFIKRNTPPYSGQLDGSRYFWRSAYLVHRQDNFYATIKFSSKRTLGAESFGGNNRSGYHLGDGVTLFYRTGNEYEEIFPVWDWRKLPGTTCAQGKLSEFRETRVDTDGAGGLTDGSEGLAALLFDRDGVKAKKAWFVSGQTVVALGAEIAGKSNDGIVTTIDQCLLRHKPVAFLGASEQQLEPGMFALEGVDRVEHNALRYEFPDRATTLGIKTGPVVGNWRIVSNISSSPKEDVTRPTMTLVINHGREVRDGVYAYIVSGDPDGSGATVLKNDGRVQAVRFKSGSLGIVFWSACLAWAH